MSVRPSPLAVVFALSLIGMAGCGKTGPLERPAPLFGPTRAAPPPSDEGAQDPTRPVRTIDPRRMGDDATNPAPARDLPIGGQNPTATDNPPQGVLPRIR